MANSFSPRQKRLIIIVAAAVIGSYGILLLLDKMIMPAWVHSTPVVAMPQLIGVNLQDAERELAGMKFAVAAVDTRPDEHYPKGAVLYQSPYGGEQVREGRKVYLTISGGKLSMELPGVVGMAVRDAKIKLQNLGFMIGGVSYAPNPAPEDDVISQLPAAGARAGVETRVSLVVSSGPPQQMVAVPALTGKTLAEAQAALLTAHLVFGTITYINNRSVLPTTVLEQQPAPNDSVETGSPVNLSVAASE